MRDNQKSSEFQARGATGDFFGVKLPPKRTFQPMEIYAKSTNGVNLFDVIY
jgi:hypothetical protein